VSNLIYSNLFRVFGASPGSEEASTLEASKSPNRYGAVVIINVPSLPGFRAICLTIKWPFFCNVRPLFSFVFPVIHGWVMLQ